MLYDTQQQYNNGVGTGRIRSYPICYISFSSPTLDAQYQRVHKA